MVSVKLAETDDDCGDRRIWEIKEVLQDNVNVCIEGKYETWGDCIKKILDVLPEQKFTLYFMQFESNPKGDSIYYLLFLYSQTSPPVKTLDVAISFWLNQLTCS